MIPIAETNINGIENFKISLFTSVFIRFLKLIFAKFLKNFNIKNNHKNELPAIYTDLTD